MGESKNKTWFLLKCATHHHKEEISSSLTHTTISIIGLGEPREQVQGSAMITTNSVAAVKSSTTRETRLWTDK